MSLASIRSLGERAPTGHAGRALLGEALRRLHSSGYGILSEVSSLAGARAGARSLLDQARGYTEGVYAELDASDVPIDTRMRGRVGAALYSCADAIRVVEDVAQSPGLVAEFERALETVLGATAGVVASAQVKALGFLTGSLWPTLLVGAAALWLANRAGRVKPIVRSVTKGLAG